MPLTTALYTGLSGLVVNQTSLDIIGNNIANVNTNGFKSSRAMIDTQFSQTGANGSPPSGVFGGTNPSQKGLGAVVGSIQRNFGSGNIQPSASNRDLAISGGGMFILQGDSTQYTRNGAFQLNSQNYLTSSSGSYVMGYGVDTNFNLVQGKLQKLEIPLGVMTVAKATTEVEMKGLLRTQGVEGTQGTMLESQTYTNAAGGPVIGTTLLTDLRDAGTQNYVVGDTLTFQGQRKSGLLDTRTMTVTATTTVSELQTFIVDGYAINTTATPTPSSIVADGAGGYKLQITGNVGETNELMFSGETLQNSGAITGPLSLATAGDASNGESVHTMVTVFDSLGNPIDMNITMVYESSSNTGKTWRFFVDSPNSKVSSMASGTGTVSFGTSGNFSRATGTKVSINLNGTGAVSPLSVDLDFTHMQGMTDPVQNTASAMTLSSMDGNGPGVLKDFSVGNDGVITGIFGNGTTRALGQVALASFANYEGLIDVGGNNFQAGPNSGEAVVSAPLQNGTGKMIGGALETSNVDISTEFINMIVASTGFSAASRVITTSNQLLTELLGIMR